MVLVEAESVVLAAASVLAVVEALLLGGGGGGGIMLLISLSNAVMSALVTLPSELELIWLNRSSISVAPDAALVPEVVLALASVLALPSWSESSVDRASFSLVWNALTSSDEAAPSLFVSTAENSRESCPDELADPVGKLCPVEAPSEAAASNDVALVLVLDFADPARAAICCCNSCCR